MRPAHCALNAKSPQLLKHSRKRDRELWAFLSASTSRLSLGASLRLRLGLGLDSAQA